jgi:HSP20 family molecular chaperone IbpA
MAQQDRKDRNQRSRSEEIRNPQTLQRTPERSEAMWRDPFTAFWEPFGLTTRNAWPLQGGRQGTSSLWTPQIETFQRGDEFVVRADLPGLKKEDVKVDITDDSVTIEGERREEHEEDREGYYRSERSYGSFYRVVPLPEGAITDNAKARFNNGVLEIVVQAPPREVSRGRRLDIADK